MRSRNCSRRARGWIAALPKVARLISIMIALVGGTASASVPPPMNYFTYRAGIDCMRSASPSGVSYASFEDPDYWTASDDGKTYTSNTLPITVGFPADEDGIARICVVKAQMHSQADQQWLEDAYTEHFGKPTTQTESKIWVIHSEDQARGLQFFPDNTSDQPQVRLIGAAF